MTTAVTANPAAAIDWQDIAEAEWYRIDNPPFPIGANDVVYASDDFDFDGVLTLTYANPAAAAAELWGACDIACARYASEYGEVVSKWHWPGS